VIAGEALFASANCYQCHSGPAWTLSRVFYTPGDENNGTLPFTKPAVIDDEMFGALRKTYYEVPDELRALNPAGASGKATFRLLPGAADGLDAFYPASSAADQINCVLRDVGTFPVQTTGAPPNTQGVAPSGAPIVRELRQNMKDLALGATGFNIPSLLGLGVGAPYFHAGNARTLEELFDGTFAAHYQALGKSFTPTSKDIRGLVAYLLTIDDDLRAPPRALPPEYDLCGQQTFR
jgi:cytochrome c peroxidase